MKFEVVQSNPSNEGKTHVTTLRSAKEVDLGVLGKKVSQVTYYISAPNKLKQGQTVELDMNMFNVAEHPFEHPETGEIIQLKWLHLR